MTFGPIHMFLICCVTAVVFTLVGRALLLSKLERRDRELESAAKREQTLLALLLRERGEREAEFSEVRRVSA